MDTTNTHFSECRFCGKNEKLCESHIISKLVYSPIKKIQKKILVVGYGQKLRKTNEIQDGPKEYLFCKECEKKRSKFEAYFGLLISKNEFFRSAQSYTVTNLDYEKLKLFVMWNIYAFHVSSLNNYSAFDPHFDDLKDMLNHNDPGDISEYGFLLWYLTDKKSDPRGCVFLLIPKKVNGQIVIDFVVCGLLFRCLIPGRAEDPLRKYFLQRNGSIFVEKLPIQNAFKKIGFL
jgi:hypothetical protein